MLVGDGYHNEIRGECEAECSPVQGRVAFRFNESVATQSSKVQSTSPIYFRDHISRGDSECQQGSAKRIHGPRLFTAVERIEVNEEVCNSTGQQRCRREYPRRRFNSGGLVRRPLADYLTLRPRDISVGAPDQPETDKDSQEGQRAEPERMGP